MSNMTVQPIQFKGGIVPKTVKKLTQNDVIKVKPQMIYEGFTLKQSQKIESFIQSVKNIFNKLFAK